jgi:hypothetical protein
MKPSRRAPLLLLVSIVGATLTAHADPPSGSDPCRAQHPGDPCEADDFEGVCKRRRCTRETDDGVRTFHCLVCESRRHHSRHRDGGAHGHGHHRHHDDDDATALDAGDEAPDAAIDDAGAVTDATPDGPASVDAARPVRLTVRTPAPRERGWLSCATSPGPAGGACGAWLALAACAALRRRVSAR